MPAVFKNKNSCRAQTSPGDLAQHDRSRHQYTCRWAERGLADLRSESKIDLLSGRYDRHHDVYRLVPSSNNTIENLARSNTATGYDFLNGRAGFDIGQTPDRLYGGFDLWPRHSRRPAEHDPRRRNRVSSPQRSSASSIGIGRLSRNWLIAKLCTVYVEAFRNLPPLLVIFFWYSGVLSTLPQPRDSLELPFSTFLNNRGLAFPKPIWGDGAGIIPIALLIGIVATIVVARWAKARQMRTGQIFPTGWVGLGLIVALPLIAFFAAGSPLTFDYPVASRFNMSGGAVIAPEFVALYLGTAPSIPPPSSPRSSAPASRAFRRDRPRRHPPLGLQPSTTTRSRDRASGDAHHHSAAHKPVSQPDEELVARCGRRLSPNWLSTGGTTFNQTGQAIEIVLDHGSVIYLSISIVTSLFMNWFNAKMALVER